MATSIIGSIQIPKGTKVTIDVDTELSPDSQNPIANSAVYEAVQKLQNQIEDINSKLDLIVVDELPTQDIDANAIYLVPLESEDEQNKFTEYIYVNSKWEKIGIYNSSVDLSQYLTKEAAESTYAKQADIPTHLPNPEALTVKYNGTIVFTYDGSTPETGNFIVNAETVPLSASDPTTISNKLNTLDSKLGDLEDVYSVNLTDLLAAEDSESISTAIGGIDNLNATVTKNQNIIGTVANGKVSVSIRNLGKVTSLYYILDTLAGYTVNEINITNTDGTLSKTVVSHSMMTEEMVIDNLTTSESTLPLSANQGKILNDTKQDTLVSGTNIKTVNRNSLLGEGDIEIQAEVPIASADTLGGIKVGEGLQIDDETGVLSSSGEYLPSVNPVVKRDGYYDATLSIGERIVLADTGSGSSEPSVKISEAGIYQGGKLDIFGWANRNQSRLSEDQLLFIDGSEPDGQDMRPATEITATRIGLGTYVASGPSAPTDLTITKTGITIKQATSEDLLHAGGGTTKLKTINNTSLLGEGNIDVSTTIPIASDTVLGGIKVGAGLEINPGTGVLSATGGGTADSVDWANITSKPISFTPSKHTHQIADVEGLQDELDGKQSAGDYALKSEVPTKVSQLNNDSNFITQDSVNSIVSDKISELVDSAPETLDTLNELAAALGDDPNFATTVTNQIGSKQDSLVSGVNIKTINGASLLGEGNITIETPEGGISDAPKDGNLYGRKDGEWSEVVIPTVPTKTSQLENDSNFIASEQLPDVSDMLTKTEASGTYQIKGNYLTSVPQAGQDVIGGIKVNYNEADKNYAVKLDGEGRAYVTVNWTSYSNATAEQAGLMSKDDKSKLDEIPENASEVSFSQSLNQGTEIGTITINGIPTTLFAPTAGESVTYGQATNTSLGLVKIGYTQNGNNYPVQLDGDGKMFVNVAESSDLQTLKEQVAKLMAEIFPLSLTVSGGGNYEQGTSQTVTITWNLTQGGDQVIPDSFTINNEPVTFSDKSKQYTQVTTNTTYVVKATVGDETLSKTLYARFYSPRYWGVVDTDFEPTEATIKGLQKLSISSSRSYSRSGISLVEQKICYAYPKSFGALTAIKDGNNFDNLGSYAQSETTVDGVAYYVYLMKDSVSGDGITQNYS